MSDHHTASRDPLLEPFQLGRLRLRNRIFSSSHAPGYNTDGTPSDRYVAYHEEKAKGGIGLTMIGGSSNVSIDSASLWGQLDFGTDAIVEPMRRMVDRIHSHGAAVMTQITHMGRRNVSNDGDWLPLIAPSPVREPMHRNFPKEAEKADLVRVVEDFSRAAQRAERSGLDGIELCATSHLLDQFWTPLSNHRTDEYGGPIENRLRFTFEVLEAIREATTPTLLVGIRMIAKEGQIGGLTVEESLEIATRLSSSGLLDFVNVTGHSLATEAGLSKAIPPSGTPLMPYASLAAAIKEAVDIPVLHATRIPDLSSARHAISAGLCDLVGMTRAHIADPHIVSKLERGEEDRIRVCVGASLCINRLHQGLDSVCIQNPATGRESLVPQLVPSGRGTALKAVVIGAGPGGLESARVLSERGHEVILFEAQDRVGGQIVVAARASKRQADLSGIVDWLEREVRLLKVEIRLSSPVDADDVLGENPDIVVVATGGWPNTGFLEFGEEFVYTSGDVLSGHAKVGGEVLVYDDHGSERALSIVEFLVDRGAGPVEIVTPDRLVGHDLSATTGPPYLRMVYEMAVAKTTDHRLIGVSRDGVRLAATLRNEYTRGETVRVVDAVIVEHGVIPNTDLYEDLVEGSANAGQTDLRALVEAKPQPDRGGSYRLYRVGDAVASRDIAAALYDARRLCQSL